jgi:large repetitive protein
VTTTSLPDAVLGARYSVPVLALSGGIPPYTWSVSARWLPPGLSLSPAGVISGSPVLAGAFDFTVQAADSAGATATASLSITVGGCATSITTVSGPVSITGKTGATVVAGNSVNGALSCSANNPAPTDGGTPNTSNGPATGQCSGLT